MTSATYIYEGVCLQEIDTIRFILDNVSPNLKYNLLKNTPFPFVFHRNWEINDITYMNCGPDKEITDAKDFLYECEIYVPEVYMQNVFDFLKLNNFKLI